MSSAPTTHTELNHFDEQELVTLVQNGNTEAFNRLGLKFSRSIGSSCSNRLRAR